MYNKIYLDEKHNATHTTQDTRQKTQDMRQHQKTKHTRHNTQDTTHKTRKAQYKVLSATRSTLVRFVFVLDVWHDVVL